MAVTQNNTGGARIHPFEINGTPFENTAPIITNFWGHTRILTIGDVSKPINGSTDITFDLSDLGMADKNHTHQLSDITNLSTLFMSEAEADSGTSDEYRLVTSKILHKLVEGANPNNISPINIKIGNTNKILDYTNDLVWDLEEIGAANVNHTHDITELISNSSNEFKEEVSNIVNDVVRLNQQYITTIGNHITNINHHYIIEVDDVTLIFPLTPNEGDVIRVTNLTETDFQIQSNGAKFRGYEGDIIVDNEKFDYTFTYTTNQGWV